MEWIGPIAGGVRSITPGFSDELRHTLLYGIHKSLIPLGIGLFVWVPLTRWIIIGLFGLAIFSELYYKECYFWFIEQEFCKTDIPDLPEHVFNMFGWNITGREKMAFTIGVNIILFAGMIWWTITQNRSSSHTKLGSHLPSPSQSEPQSGQKGPEIPSPP